MGANLVACITLLGTGSIQSYVFGSNRLAENAGASYLIEQALERWRDDKGKTYRFIYAGGGNAALWFQDRDAAVSAVREWSRELLTTAPGLRVVVGHGVAPEGKERTAYKDALADLMRNENAPQLGCEPGALPVSQVCGSTGRMATQNKNSVWVSGEAACKKDNEEVARAKQQERYLRNHAGFVITNRQDHFGTREGQGQVAIVHADGDAIGALFANIGEEEGLDGKDFLGRLTELSEAVTRVANDSLQTLIDELIGRCRELEQQGLALHLEQNDKCLPLRPIVAAGDDLTFACHGRFALALTARYLQVFAEKATDRLPKRTDPYTACAGVAIMPGKFPFARGYVLANELCRNAKKKRREMMNAGAETACWLDFHILTEGAAGSLEFMRRSLYQGRTGSFLRRPYCVNGPGSSWVRFEEIWRRFRTWPRNRAKRLLEGIVQGEQEFQRLARAFESRDYPLPREQDWTEFFDPLEALDFHVDAWMEKANVATTP